jgi:hypothetical protein
MLQDASTDPVPDCDVKPLQLTFNVVGSVSEEGEHNYSTSAVSTEVPLSGLVTIQFNHNFGDCQPYKPYVYYVNSQDSEVPLTVTD